jgi:hypothetical protein
MTAFQAVPYLIAVVLLVLAAFGVGGRISLPLLAAALALTAYAWPAVAALSH